MPDRHTRGRPARPRVHPAHLSWRRLCCVARREPVIAALTLTASTVGASHTQTLTHSRPSTPDYRSGHTPVAASLSPDAFITQKASVPPAPSRSARRASSKVAGPGARSPVGAAAATTSCCWRTVARLRRMATFTAMRCRRSVQRAIVSSTSVTVRARRRGSSASSSSTWDKARGSSSSSHSRKRWVSEQAMSGAAGAVTEDHLERLGGHRR